MRCTLLVLAALLLAGCQPPQQPPATTPAIKPTEPAKIVTATEEKDPLRLRIIAALKQVADDPEGLEIVEWGEKRPMPLWEEMEIRFRARTPQGGKKVYEWRCLIQKGYPISFLEIDPFNGNTRQMNVPK